MQQLPDVTEPLPEFCRERVSRIDNGCRTKSTMAASAEAPSAIEL